MIILYDDDVVSVTIPFLSPKHMERHSLLMLAYLTSMSVRVLLMKAIGLPFCITAALWMYSLAFVWIIMGFVQS